MVRQAPLLLALAANAVPLGLFRPWPVRRPAAAPALLFAAAVAVLVRRRLCLPAETCRLPPVLRFLLEFLLCLLLLELAELLIWSYITDLVFHKLPAIGLKVQGLGFWLCSEATYHAGVAIHDVAGQPLVRGLLLYVVSALILLAVLSWYRIDVWAYPRLAHCLLASWAERAHEILRRLARSWWAPAGVEYVDARVLDEDVNCAECEQ